MAGPSAAMLNRYGSKGGRVELLLLRAKTSLVEVQWQNHCRFMKGQFC